MGRGRPRKLLIQFWGRDRGARSGRGAAMGAERTSRLDGVDGGGVATMVMCGTVLE